MTPRVLALVGLPGTGKTALAQAIATHRNARGRPAVVLHVDLLRHTLRLAGFRSLEGPIWEGDPNEQFRIVHPYMHQHADKARRDGYDLIVEGSLAIGFQAADRYIQLQVAEPIRQRRVQQLHPAARRLAAGLDPLVLEEIMEEHAVDFREVLTTDADLGDLVLGIESTWNPPLLDC